MKSSFYKEKETRNKLVDFILNTGVLSMGKQCRNFEQNFTKKQQRKFAVLVNSGSSANLILIQSLFNLNLLNKGDKIGVSALTWSTNIMPIIQLGFVPVLLDCEKTSLNVSPEILAKRLKEIKCLFLTNALGFSDRIDEIKSLCERNKTILIEDNCESLGSKTAKKHLGNFGLASTFSFFVGHHLSTIEGGMICTDDEELFYMLTMVKAHGWDRHLPQKRKQELQKRHGVNDFFAKYTFYELAYNARPTEITGFIGNLQIKYWDEIVRKREKNFWRFQKITENNSDFIALKLEHMDLISNFAMPLICKNKKLYLKYRNKFSKAGVEIRPIIAGDISRQPFLKKYYKTNEKLPNAYFVHQNGFYFPNNPELTEKELNLLCNLLKKDE